MPRYIICNGELYHLDDGSEELYHYGVLGMKWGMRRAKKQGVDYTYRSHGQKKWTKRLAKYKAKGIKGKKLAKAKDKLELFKQRDKNREDYARSTTVGKEIVKNILLTPMGAGRYNRMRAAGYSRRTAFRFSDKENGGIMSTRHREFNTARRDIKRRKKN